MNYYTGIGSRQTPPEILSVMTDIARFLAETGYVLRSGGASGADTAFESGVLYIDKKEIYLPWKGFNGNKSTLYEVSDEAMDIAAKFHPVWDKLSQGARRLMGRNCYQVLGVDLYVPSDFVLCWTKGGKEVGGTALAMRLAKEFGVPVYNLFFEKHRSHVMSWITKEKVTL
jgi:hypothetical protein